jgi:hypothetical protein
VNKRWNN